MGKKKQQRKRSKKNRQYNREENRKRGERNLGKFVDQLGKFGLRIKVMKGDGNCLFRAFADQIEGNEENCAFYRQEAINYMIEQKSHFENFIEDDVKFDDYIVDMSKDGKWGGNLEIYALSMKFNVNFYIHLYNAPIYIIENFTEPFKVVHLSYHEGQHYNSVRLATDFKEDVPDFISPDVIKGIGKTDNACILDEIENAEIKDGEEVKEADKKEVEGNEVKEKPKEEQLDEDLKKALELSQKPEDELELALRLSKKQEEDDKQLTLAIKNSLENLKLEDGKEGNGFEDINRVAEINPTNTENAIEQENIVNEEDLEYLLEDVNDLSSKEFRFYHLEIKDLSKMPTNDIYDTRVLLENGSIINVPNDKGKCHCKSKKQYQKCCKSKDISGEYDDQKKIFYCQFDFERYLLVEYRKHYFQIRKNNLGKIPKQEKIEVNCTKSIFKDEEEKYQEEIIKKLEQVSKEEYISSYQQTVKKQENTQPKKKYDKIYI